MASLNQMFSLENKVVLVTGASGYLGQAMAYALAEAGAMVLVNSRDHGKCEDLVSSIKRLGFLAQSAVFDVSNGDSIKSFFDSSNIKKINGIVNNAYSGGAGSIENTAQAEYLNSYSVSVLAAHNIVRDALPLLRRAVIEDGDASVVNVASMYGMVSPDHRIYESASAVNPPFYGASKAALIQWSRYAACEFGHEGIRVNSISPGPFPAPTVQVQSPFFVDSLSKKVPLGRIGISEDIKGPIVFLIARSSSFINGANIVVDGGWTAW
ncbi:SDR family NAD(P)-dependent oxidoreductase [Pseudomonas sp. TTU2014-080ASC]|uniref:SDR family NAD(P)-dependent oxidoreductase n=1 Tax=Pseudomonas sp. TTU2014-080ASC TaxID=1729724 RepID=UPI0009E9039A|nr:SDR family oxidoreductase [Pseudomonas sp. TTU2014-080ASC]